MLDVESELNKGKQLTPSGATRLERLLKKNENQIIPRIRLIAFYWKKGRQGYDLHVHHLIRLIEYFPDLYVWRHIHLLRFRECYSSDSYEKALELWSTMTENFSSDPDVHGNAGLFLVDRFPATGLRLLCRAVELDSVDYDGSYWSQRLTLILFRLAKDARGSTRVEFSQKCLNAGEEYLRRLGTEGVLWRDAIRERVLEACLACALWTNRNELADYFARELMAVLDTWNHKPRSSQLLLALHALRRATVQDAVSRLFLHAGTPSIGLFELELLQALISIGEMQAALLYLEECKSSGASEPKLDGWIASLRNGAFVSFE